MITINPRLKPAQGTAEIRQRAKWLDGDVQAKLEEVLRSSEFRSLRFEIDQMRYIFDLGPRYSYRIVAKLFNKSKSRVHTLLTETGPREVPIATSEATSLAESRGPSLLTESEENEIVEWINKKQRKGNCATPLQVRERASRIYERRTGVWHDFDRSWWKRLKRRHEELQTCWVNATEGPRVAVTEHEVEKYFASVLSALMEIQSPKQLVNLDEVGLCQRPDKGRRRRVVVSSSVSRSPTFAEQEDGSHITLTAAVNLAGESLRPFLIGVNALSFKTRDLWLLSNTFTYMRTKKGRQTRDSFTYYAQSTLQAYVESVRNELRDSNAKVYLLMDNATVHEIEDILDALGIVCIWLPPHSSHFLQVLDLLVFAELKKAYRATRTKKTKPKIEGKLLHILSAWHKASYRLTIIKAWERAGITAVKGPGGELTTNCRFALNFRRIHLAIRTNCPDTPDDVERLWSEVDE